MSEWTVSLVYCSNLNCDNQTVTSPQLDSFCEECGNELVPCPVCHCGREINPKRRFAAKFCAACGREWTSAYVVERIAVQLAAWEQVKARAVHAN